MASSQETRVYTLSWKSLQGYEKTRNASDKVLSIIFRRAAGKCKRENDRRKKYQNVLFHKLYHPMTFWFFSIISYHSQNCQDKTKKSPQKSASFLVGEGGFEPPKLEATDLQSAPFGHSGILPYEWKQNNGAGGRTRTPDLLITNQLLYQLSYTSLYCLICRTDDIYYIISPSTCQAFFILFSFF